MENFKAIKLVTLRDCVALAEQYPDTFQIPDSEAKSQISVGDFVKLCFEYHGKYRLDREFIDERMWVRVTSIEGDRYQGELENEPVIADVLEIGNTVDFEPRHIAGVMLTPAA